jgi:hypothetical protein
MSSMEASGPYFVVRVCRHKRHVGTRQSLVPEIDPNVACLPRLCGISVPGFSPGHPAPMQHRLASLQLSCEYAMAYFNPTSENQDVGHRHSLSVSRDQHEWPLPLQSFAAWTRDCMPVL